MAGESEEGHCWTEAVGICDLAQACALLQEPWSPKLHLWRRRSQTSNQITFGGLEVRVLARDKGLTDHLLKHTHTDSHVAL